jgi:hypothetical protein
VGQDLGLGLKLHPAQALEATGEPGLD